MLIRVVVGLWWLLVLQAIPAVVLCWRPTSSPTTSHRKNHRLLFQEPRKIMTSQFSTTKNAEDSSSLDASNAPIQKRILCVRHGISIANEWMSEPGNQWGDANFKEDGKPDAPLSETGRKETRNFLNRQFASSSLLSKTIQEAELVIVSPLTRCLETFYYGVEPHLPRDKKIPILAVPLLRERVYTTSDTGRVASDLAKEFPNVDFSELPQDDSPWWYTVAENEDWEEWRPHDKNQWYGVPGEPQDVFAERMKELDEWIANRPETTIVMVSHWGILRHLTDGTQFENAQAKVLLNRVFLQLQ